MSHGKERKEKNCLNCGSLVKGRFCHICGQENVAHSDTFWGLITHFVYDITHFDSKFFTTLKWLITKPGLLSKEYMRGRRAAYLNPIKMYVFTSAFFFILFFTFNKSKDYEEKTGKEILTIENSDPVVAKEPTDSQKLAGLSLTLNAVDSSKASKEIPAPRYEYDSAGFDNLKKGPYQKTDLGVIRLFGGNLPKTTTAYKQAQDSLPVMERDGWFKRYVKQKAIKVNAKYEGRRQEFAHDFKDKFLHSIPKMMFVSLPLVAFFFSILYFRHKRFMYANHGIHVVHLYIAIFILIFFSGASEFIHHYLPWRIFNWISSVITLGIFYYLYRSMRNFYEQGRAKTLLKYVLLLGMIGMLFTILSVVFVVNVLLNI